MQAPEIDQAAAIKSGWAAYDDLRFREAESWFACLVHRSQAAPVEAVCGLSAAKRATGRPAEAARLVEEALRVHRDEPRLCRQLGYIAFEQRRFEDAAVIFADLTEAGPCGAADLRWQVASLRRAGDYLAAASVLENAPEEIADHRDLDIERGWVAYGGRDFQLAAEHFRAARAHRAPHDLFVPPLVTALLRLNQPDAAAAVADEAAACAPSSPIACAQADVEVQRGHPQEAIQILTRFGTALDDHGMRQLVILLIGADREAEAWEFFRTWCHARCGKSDYALKFASPPVVATSIDLAGRKLAGHRDRLIAKVQSRIDLYKWPDTPPAEVAASAICVLRTVDKKEAMKRAVTSAGRHPRATDVLIEKAKTSFACHLYDEAIETLDAVLGREPDNDRALQWRFRSMRRLGKWAELEDTLKRAVGIHKHSARLRIELGWLLLTKGDFGGARDAFSEALRLDKSSQQARFGRISALRRMQRWSDASAELGRWKREWPNSKRRCLAEAMLKLDREEFARAMRLFKGVDSVSGLLGQASVLTQQGEISKAITALQEAQAKDYDRPGVKIALAMLLLQQAETCEQNKEKLRKGNKRDWDYVNALCNDAMEWGAESDAAALSCRAQLAVDQGHPHAAESLLREAIQHNPYATRANSALAGVLVSMHRIDDAVDVLTKHISKYGPNSSAQFQLYRALLARGDSEEALAALRTALGLATAPERDTLAVALAYELEEQGCSAEAERLLRSWLDGRDTARDDLLRLGLAWILLSRGDRGQSPALLQEAVAQATQVIVRPDQGSAAVRPQKIKDEALKCRGTAYYKLAENERNPRDRILFARLARHDQGERNIAKGKVPPGARLLARLAAGLDTGLRMLSLIAALTLIVVLWVLHANDPTAWTTPMVMSLTPLFIAVVLLTALLPQLQSLKLAGLEAQTREPPDVPLPTSPSVVLPLVTEFAAVAHESFLDAIDVSDLIGSSSTPLQGREQGTPLPARDQSTPRRLEPLARSPSPLARSG
jgi:tetratricopeptide (TPR) repeat protein